MDETYQVLTSQEIESYLESLQILDIPDIGSPRWLLQQERLHSLSVQATLDVKAEKEEITKEHLVMLQKVPVLIHELIATELWRLNIFPLLTKMEVQLKSMIPIFMVLYHEATLVAFFEAMLYHEDIIESAGDCLIDLIDYSYRKVVRLKVLDDRSLVKDRSPDSEISRLLEQKQEMEFECGIKCISLISYTTQHLKIIPLSVLHRLLVIHDVPLLFTELMVHPPWEREFDGTREKYYEGKWHKVNPINSMKLSKTEGQIWIALMQLLLNADCQQKYHISGFKKDQLLKLRSKLNDVVMDQIPMLKELLRYLEHLGLFDAPAPKHGIVIEQQPEIWEALQTEYKGKWEKIASDQMDECFCLSETELQQFCKKLSSTFDMQNIEAIISDTPLCANCRGKASKRCSRCKNEWYCKRQCQVSHWSKHKSACDLMEKEE